MALGEIGPEDPAVIPALAQAMTDEFREDLAEPAAMALGAIGPPAIPVLTAHFTTTVPTCVPVPPGPSSGWDPTQRRHSRSWNAPRRMATPTPVSRSRPRSSSSAIPVPRPRPMPIQIRTRAAICPDGNSESVPIPLRRQSRLLPPWCCSGCGRRRTNRRPEPVGILCSAGQPAAAAAGAGQSREFRSGLSRKRAAILGDRLVTLGHPARPRRIQEASTSSRRTTGSPVTRRKPESFVSSRVH